MVRRIFSVVIGVLTGSAALWLVENWLSHILIARPDSQFPQDPELVAEYIAALPVGALWMVVLAMFVGGFVASFIAQKVYGGASTAARDAGFLMLLITFLNLFVIPHPTWMMVAMPLATILGSLLAMRVKRSVPQGV